MQNYNLKPINTVFSTDSILNIEELIQAKVFLNENYGNKYSFIPPHLTYTIMPFPEKNFEAGKRDLIEYISQQKAYKVRILDLEYEEDRNFFRLALDDNAIKEHHRNITLLLNKYREDYVREKDLKRLKENKFDEQDIQYLKEYGYSRVFDNFNSHITVGNFTIDNVDPKRLEKKLRSILSSILNKEIVIDNIHAVFHTDSAGNQSEMKQMWDETFKLSE